MPGMHGAQAQPRPQPHPHLPGDAVGLLPLVEHVALLLATSAAPQVGPCPGQRT